MVDKSKNSGRKRKRDGKEINLSLFFCAGVCGCGCLIGGGVLLMARNSYGGAFHMGSVNDIHTLTMFKFV